jgi:hypothetical protein
MGKIDRISIEPLDDGSWKGEVSMKKEKKNKDHDPFSSYDTKTFSVASLDEALEKIKEIESEGPDKDDVKTERKGHMKVILGL